jgi:tetratricopeptide (TPR) repeat protein
LGKCEIVENTSNLLIRWGHIELAMNLLNESINTTSGETKIDAEYVLVTVFHLLGDVNTALKIYNNVKYKYEEMGNKKEVAGTLHQLGMIHQDQGNYEEAVKLYNQSLKICKELGDKSGIAYTLGQIRRINEEEGEYSSALRNYLISFSIFEQLNSSIKEIVARSILRLRDKMGEEEFDVEFKKLVNE